MLFSTHFRWSLATTFAILSSSAGLSQADQLGDSVALAVSQVKARKPLDDSEIKKAAPLDVYRTVEPLLDERTEDETIKTLALSWISGAVNRAANRAERTPGVAILLKYGLAQQPAGGAFAFRSLVQVARTGDFDESQLKEIAKLLQGPSPSKDSILLAGIGGSDLIVQHLKVLVGAKSTTIARAAQLALARTGDKEMNETVAKQFLASSLEDKMRRASELTYVRNSYAIEALRICLYSDDEIPSDGDMIGEKLSHVALDNLKRFVEGFPESARYVITEEDVTKAREWMKGRSNFKIKP